MALITLIASGNIDVYLKQPTRIDLPVFYSSIHVGVLGTHDDF